MVAMTIATGGEGPALCAYSSSFTTPRIVFLLLCLPFFFSLLRSFAPSLHRCFLFFSFALPLAPSLLFFLFAFCFLPSVSFFPPTLFSSTDIRRL